MREQHLVPTYRTETLSKSYNITLKFQKWMVKGGIDIAHDRQTQS